MPHVFRSLILIVSRAMSALSRARYPTRWKMEVQVEPTSKLFSSK